MKNKSEALIEYKEEYAPMRTGDCEDLAFDCGWDACKESLIKKYTEPEIVDLFCKEYSKLENCEPVDVLNELKRSDKILLECWISLDWELIQNNYEIISLQTI